jgi:hypothetical protein
MIHKFRMGGRFEKDDDDQDPLNAKRPARSGPQDDPAEAEKLDGVRTPVSSTFGKNASDLLRRETAF